MDPYLCLLDFLMVLEAERGEINLHFEYVAEDIKVIEVSLKDLIVPQGERDGWELYRDFVKEFKEFLREENISAMRHSIRLILSTLSPNLFYTDVLRGIDLLLDFYPKSKTYIETLLESLGIQELPGDLKEKTPEVEKYFTEVIKTQIEVLESLPTMPEAQRSGVEESLRKSLLNLFTSLNREDLVPLIREASLEDLKSALVGLLESFRKEEKTLKFKQEILEKQPTRGEEKQIKTFRVEEWKIDRFMNLVGEMVVSKNSLVYLIKKEEEERDLRWSS